MNNKIANFAQTINEYDVPFKMTTIIPIEKISATPDDNYYKFLIKNKVYYIYEVDYISSLDYQIGEIKKVLGNNIKLISVKKRLEFNESKPALWALTYAKPDDWDNISIYVTDTGGTQEYYFKFLIEMGKIE